MDEPICPICGRVLGKDVDDHHLIPKSLGGAKKGTVTLHKVCHTKINHTFSERELQKRYNTVGAIRGHPEMQKFIEWIQKKPPDYYVGHKDTHHRKKRRR